MAKFRTLSRAFLKGHPNEGKPTYFVEKFLTSLDVNYQHASYFHKLCELNPTVGRAELQEFYMSLSNDAFVPKKHTIRNGRHFMAGDMISIRAWIGKPYNSTPIRLWDDLKVMSQYTYTIENGVHICNHEIANIMRVCKNDGLRPEDFILWFPETFAGQVICWKEVKY